MARQGQPITVSLGGTPVPFQRWQAPLLLKRDLEKSYYLQDPSYMVDSEVAHVYPLTHLIFTETQ